MISLPAGRIRSVYRIFRGRNRAPGLRRGSFGCRGFVEVPEGASGAQNEHECDRGQRAEHGADRIERLAQAVGRAALRDRGDVGDQRIARRTAQALAETAPGSTPSRIASKAGGTT